MIPLLITQLLKLLRFYNAHQSERFYRILMTASETLNQTRCPSSQLSWWENSSTLHPKSMGFNHQRYRIRVTLLDNFPHLAACILKSGWVAASIVTQCPEPSVFGGFICFDVRVYIIYLTTHFQWYWGFLRLPQSCNIRQGLASHFGWWLGRVRKMAGDPLNRQPKPKLSYACS